ncbi:hypothetical protein NYR07_13625, partial [Lacticaseibacillus rhamnosus]|uniref:hypothetical protein n=1 Tax=Lacticaseibacillus rhamnosus TaxID=47715 RepID=UPI0028DD695F
HRTKQKQPDHPKYRGNLWQEKLTCATTRQNNRDAAAKRGRPASQFYPFPRERRVPAGSTIQPLLEILF